MDNEQLYALLRSVPQRKVVTYAQLGEWMGNARLARAVGNALHRNPDGRCTPCYRVVNSKGALSEHYAFGGREAQRQLLEAEGIVVQNYRVDLSIYQYKKER